MPEYQNKRPIKRKKKRSGKKEAFLLGGFVLSVAVFVFCVIKLIQTAFSYRTDRKTYDMIAEQFTSDSTFSDSADTVSATGTVSGTNTEPVDINFSAADSAAGSNTGTNPDTQADSGIQPQGSQSETEKKGTFPETVTLPFRVDWDSLAEENPETVGWLYCEGTPLNYPVVQGSDNSFYLTHDFYRKDSDGGALFLDMRNEISFETDHLIIYGHRMKDDSMFGNVADCAEEQYYRSIR